MQSMMHDIDMEFLSLHHCIQCLYCVQTSNSSRVRQSKWFCQ